ncbi:MAG: hypothetical protein V5A44_01015 [Haloarculaceae archaeon]
MAGDRPGPRSVDATGDGGTDADADGEGDDDDAARRRRLIKYVLIIAFAVPLVVEGATLVGLVGSYVGDDATAAPTPTPTPDEAITEGSQLLSETERDERVTTTSLRSSGDGWTLVVSVRVENTGDLPYELRLGSVTTSGGRTVEGSATTGRVVPGESATVSAQWSLPAGDRPDTVAVTAVEYDDGERVLVDREVRVGRVPVEG